MLSDNVWDEVKLSDRVSKLWLAWCAAACSLFCFTKIVIGCKVISRCMK